MSFDSRLKETRFSTLDSALLTVMSFAVFEGALNKLLIVALAPPLVPLGPGAGVCRKFTFTSSSPIR